jgi:hypothetical protein
VFAAMLPSEKGRAFASLQPLDLKRKLFGLLSAVDQGRAMAASSANERAALFADLSPAQRKAMLDAMPSKVDPPTHTPPPHAHAHTYIIGLNCLLDPTPRTRT